jgi:hypothetical protein
MGQSGGRPRKSWRCQCGTLQYPESDVCDTCAETWPEAMRREVLESAAPPTLNKDPRRARGVVVEGEVLP